MDNEFTSFQIGFREEAETALENNTIKIEIAKIRKHWQIPPKGFSQKTQFSEAIKWIIEQSKEYYKYSSIIFDELELIKCKPKYFLNDVLETIKNTDDGYPMDLYFGRGAEFFTAIINERPFPGIVHYILFNEILIPESNQVQLTQDKYKNVVVRMGPNATHESMLNTIKTLKDFFQKNHPRFSKGKTRRKKYNRIDLEIHNNNLSGLTASDKYPNSKFGNEKNEQAKMRKRKERINKRINKPD